MKLASIILAYALFALPSQAGSIPGAERLPPEQRQLLEFVAAAHRATREQIRSSFCKVEFTDTVQPDPAKPPNISSCRCDYWYTKDAVRGQMHESAGHSVDYVWKDSVVYSISSKNRGEWRTGHKTASPSPHTHRCDPWIRGLLVINLPNTTAHLPFEQLLEKASSVTKVERIKEKGQELISVKLRFDVPPVEKGYHWTVDVQFDPSVNYMVRRVIYDNQGAIVRNEEVTSFKECEGGVYFPEHGTEVTENRGKHFASGESKIFDIRVNQAMPEDLFQLRMPDGILFSDSSKGVYYQADAHGNPVTPPKEIRRGGALPPNLAEVTQGQVSRAETVQQPWPWTTWIFLCSGALLVFAAPFLLWRLWRYRKAMNA
jgi:hypothetical protein